MYQDPDQYPETVKTIFPSVIKPQVMRMPEGGDLEEIADGHQRSAIAGIGFVPVDAIAV
jgi:hypothetical protein